ncbi:MAG: hypothetical protein ACKVK0_10695 [Pirellulales bacterium]
MPSEITRRQFQGTAMQSLLTFSLLETLFGAELFAKDIRPVTAQWLKELNTIAQDLKGTKLTQGQWKNQCEKLFNQVNLRELLEFIDFDGRISQTPFRENGERAIRFRFPEVEGLPTNLIFGHQIFKLKQGQSVVPHGHNNMATAFLVLQGSFHGRHYDRLEDTQSHMIIKPTINGTFKRGDVSSITDQHDNVHWFKATAEQGYIFNIHVLNLNDGNSGRVYIDPNGEALNDGSIRARKITAAEATKLYG